MDIVGMGETFKDFSTLLTSHLPSPGVAYFRSVGVFLSFYLVLLFSYILLLLLPLYVINNFHQYRH